jgi:hypothetical protein
MSNSRSLTDICNDLKKFEKIIFDIKEKHASTYDEYLSIPNWRSNKSDEPEDFATAISASLGKFSAHVDMLQHPSNLIKNSGTNSEVITEIAAQLNKYVSAYRNFTKIIANKSLCRILNDDLGHIDNILKTYNNHLKPPSNSQ